MTLSVLKDTAYPVGRQDRHFYLCLFLLSRKASNAITKPPNEIINPLISMKIIIISADVICVAVFAPASVRAKRMSTGHPAPFLCILDIPVLQAGRLPPCHGCFPRITLSYFYKKFNLNHAFFLTPHINHAAPC